MNNNVVLLILFGILCTDTLADVFISEIKSHDLDDYDVTTIYELQDPLDGSVECSRPDKLLDDGTLPSDCFYDVSVSSRSNAIGMPIYFNGKVLTSRNYDLEFIIDYEYSNNIFTNNHVEHNETFVVLRGYVSLMNTNKRIYPAGGLITGKYLNVFASLNISWTPYKTSKGCISLTYNWEDQADNEANVKIYQKDNNIPMISYKISKPDGLNTLKLRTNDLFVKNTTYFLVITSPDTKNGSYRIFGIKRIAQCDEDSDSYVIPGIRIKKDDIAASIYQIDGKKRVDSTRLQKECDPNRFGADCSGTCSIYNTFCERQLFCTTRYGCSCASGYFGDFCDQKCLLGTFGRDCKQRCNENCISCDIYTGTCTGGCKRNYISPNCTETYPRLINPPQLVSSDFTSIKLNLSFASENIGGSQQQTPLYYQLVYKQSTSELDFQYLDIKEKGSSVYTLETIDNLFSETEYIFGVILFTEEGKRNDEIVSTAYYRTSCIVPENIDYGVQLLRGANYINVTWEKYHSGNSLECRINKYTLKLIFDEKKDLYEEANSTSTKYVFENLIPGHVYTVQLTAVTDLGHVEPSEIFNATTNYEHGDIAIKNIKAKSHDTNTGVHLTWELRDSHIDAPISYKILYKINRVFSCSFGLVNSTDWTEILVYNKTEYDLRNLIPNSQYMIQVQTTADVYTPGNIDHMIFVKTAPSTPTFAPVIDPSHPLYFDNETALIKWMVDKQYCMKLNGPPKGFHLILKNLKNGTQNVQETDETSIKYTGLTPNTDYELQIYIKTTIGFNTVYMLSIPFKTKTEFLAPVEDLTVYKKNSKFKAASLRWKYSNDSQANGFIIHVYNEKQKTMVNQITMEPSPCKAWPDYYCSTVVDLTPSTEYTIKMKAKSVDYPNGGISSSVSFNTIDGAPDEPGNLRSSFIGDTDITLEWDIPWMLNGVLKVFIINTEEISAVDLNSCCNSLPTAELQVTEEMPTYNYTINNLKPGSTYSIEVLSKTTWHGQAKKIQVTTLSDSPSQVSETS
ncbi:uncharacterized protein LOC126841533 [Adelges cooleyi]|uniref:uncharacterized protein LOC126841533 n=1 Tax=Adelges cooleyi TaxID=133065 RepID=UPI0021802E6B|nr:uncharacterized protein LOC126841533 [Adelges cooleyi]